MPLHKHEDCPSCIYLGSNIEQNEDYYFCKRISIYQSTLIARFGVEGRYISGIDFYGMNPSINRAGNIAVALGHLTLKEIQQINPRVKKLEFINA